MAEVKGIPRPRLSWSLDDTPLVESQNIKISYFEDVATVLINNLEAMPIAGIVRCKAWNDLGVAESFAQISTIQDGSLVAIHSSASEIPCKLVVFRDVTIREMIFHVI